jgi:hypothetical protein
MPLIVSVDTQNTFPVKPLEVPGKPSFTGQWSVKFDSRGLCVFR